MKLLTAKAVIYDGSSVTSPKNWSNPHPGDLCYTLHTDSRNYVVIPIAVGVHEMPTVINLNKDDFQSKTILDIHGIAPSICAGEGGE